MDRNIISRLILFTFSLLFASALFLLATNQIASTIAELQATQVRMMSVEDRVDRTEILSAFLSFEDFTREDILCMPDSQLEAIRETFPEQIAKFKASPSFSTLPEGLSEDDITRSWVALFSTPLQNELKMQQQNSAELQSVIEEIIHEIEIEAGERPRVPTPSKQMRGPGCGVGN